MSPLPISNPATGTEWPNLRQSLTNCGFEVLQDTDPRPDAFSAQTRTTILSSSVVLLDGRLNAASGNIHPDIAYALGLARAYHKRIVLLVSANCKAVDRESIYKVFEADEVTAEIAVQLVNAVLEAFRTLSPPYLNPASDGALAISLTDLSLCPILRADVLQLIERYQWYWHALERISQGLNLLLGPVELAASEESNFNSNDIVTRIGQRFFNDYQSHLGGDFSKIANIAGKVDEYQDDADRIIERIRSRAGRKSDGTVARARDFLKLFFVRVSRL